MQTVAVLNLLTDLAFNLLIFFVVLASNEAENRGRTQQVPSASKDEVKKEDVQNIAVKVTRTTVAVNDEETPIENLVAKLTEKLTGKAAPDDRTVVVSLDNDTPYSTYIKVSGLIEQAGGIITLEVEDEKEVMVR